MISLFHPAIKALSEVSSESMKDLTEFYLKAKKKDLHLHDPIELLYKTLQAEVFFIGHASFQ